MNSYENKLYDMKIEDQMRRGKKKIQPSIVVLTDLATSLDGSKQHVMK